MTEYFVELVNDNKDELFPDAKQKGARLMSTNAWQTVHRDFINQYPHCGVSLEQIKEKWKYVKKVGKEDNQKLKK